MTAKKTTSSRASTSRKATASKATARRPAAKAAPKQPAAKKSAAGKPAAKKSAAKKPAAKKSAAKKPAAKKSAVRKPAAKKSAVRKPAAKKPAAARRSSKASAKPAATKPAASAVRSPARKRKPVSPFRVGDKVVYPHHGAAVIIKKERRDFNKSKVDFFVLEVAIDQLILRVPVESAAELGVRPVISKTAARKVLAVFRTEPEEAGANWSRWYKLLTEKIQSGDIYQVAEVVRDLTFAQQTKGISPALKRMLSKARLILASELRFVLDLSEEEAMKRLDKALPKVDSEEDE
jgi:CarD family transcriptional regulator